jgi:hypothetical protein
MMLNMAQKAAHDKLCCAQSRKSQQWNKKKKKTKLQVPASEMNKLILVCSPTLYYLYGLLQVVT